MIFTDSTTAQQRYLICKSCERFRPFVKQCAVCLCFMPAKVRMAQAECPEKRWTRVDATCQDEYSIDEEL